MNQLQAFFRDQSGRESAGRSRQISDQPERAQGANVFSVTIATNKRDEKLTDVDSVEFVTQARDPPVPVTIPPQFCCAFDFIC